tara:strand:- start:205 stop:345 length:141 start_codon:yes stop_codon:yes gene_type:complete
MTWMNRYQSELEPPDSYWKEPSDDDDHDQDAADMALEQELLEEDDQ